MEKKLLVSGKNSLIIDDIYDYLPFTYQIQSCNVSRKELSRQIFRYKPNMILVCLDKESNAEMMAYDTLKERSEYVNIPIFVVGYEDECKKFTTYVGGKTTTIIKRPTRAERIIVQIEKKYDEMEQKEKEKENKEQKAASPIVQPKVKAAMTQEEQPKIQQAKVTNEQPVGKEDPKVVMKKAKRYDDEKHILVVDDDQRMLKIIKAHLSDYYHVAVSTSGKMALKFLETHHTDLILLDYLMPEEDGYEVLKKIRSHSQLSNLPVIYLTGVKDPQMVKKCLTLKPNGYLLKPVDRDVLLNKVAECL